MKAKIPNKLKFFLENSDKLEFITSVITKAEVARELAASYGLSEKEIEAIWNEFIKLLNCKFVERVEIDSKFSSLPAKIKLKLRTLMNFKHLFVAMKYDSYLLTGDKYFIKAVRENKIYDKILSYIELRKLIT